MIVQWLKYLQTKSVGHVVRFGSAIWRFQYIFLGSSGVKSPTFDWNHRYPVRLLECWDKKFQLDISNSKLQTEYFQLTNSKLILMTGLNKNRLRSLKVLRVFLSNRNTFPDLIVSNFQHILSPWQIFVKTFSSNWIFGFRGQDERTKSFVRHVLILFCSLCSLLWDLKITYWINIRFYVTVTVVSLL